VDGRLLPVNPFHLLGKYEPASRGVKMVRPIDLNCSNTFDCGIASLAICFLMASLGAVFGHHWNAAVSLIRWVT
jgi:hypothetical protein